MCIRSDLDLHYGIVIDFIMRFTAKLVAAVVLTALIPVATIGYLSYSSAKSALEKQSLKSLTIIADAKEGHLYSFFEAVKGRAIDFSSDGFIRDRAEAMQKLDSKDPRFAELQKSLNKHLKHNKQTLDKSIRLIFVVDLNGNVISSTDERELGASESDDDYFVHGKKGVYMSDVHKPPRITEGVNPHIAVSVPLTCRKKGAPLGVIINFYDTTELDKILSGQYQIEKGAATTISDKIETLDSYLVNKNKLLITPSRYSSEILRQKVETLPVLECAAGKVITGIYKNYLGNEVLGASMCIPSFGWTLLAEIDSKEAFAPVAEVRDRVIMLGIVVALLAFFLAYILSRESQRSILAEKSRLDALIRDIKEGVVFADSNDNVVLLNPSAENIFGVKGADVIGRQILHCYQCNMENFVKILEMFKNGSLENYSSEAAYKDRDFEVTLSPIKSATDYIGTVMVFHDITERKKMENLILQSKLEWEDTFNTMTDLVTLHDNDFNIIKANKAAEKILGLPSIEEAKEKCYKYFHGLDNPPEWCPCYQSIKTGTSASSELFNPHLNMFIEVKVIPRFDSNNQVIGFIHIVRDITERKKLEEQLLHSQKMEAIGTLAGGVAHDFNNILTAIIGYGGILQMKMRDDDPLKVHVEQILASSDRAANLTRSLLAFSRKQIMNPRPVDMNKVVKGVEKLLLRIIGEDIQLKTILAEKDLIVMADSGQMEQILMNLATNARDAMPDGGVLTMGTETMRMDTEYIKTHGYGKPGEYVLVSVTDTGAGMDEKTRERIFEPFFTTKEIGKGTGLGLAMVYGIVKQHKGYINVYSEIGKGTTFKIYLPLVETNIVEEAKTKEVITLIGGTETILLAEDDIEVRKLMRNVLEEFGYKIIEAEDGEDAVNKFAENRDSVQLLILDVVMPNKNGKEAYEDIKKLRADVRALFISGYTANIIHERGILEEGINFISKPVSPGELLKTVREVLDK